MDKKYLSGKKVAILATDGFEQDELIEPKRALELEGAEVKVISPKGIKIKSWHGKDWGFTISVDQVLDVANADDFDALVLPGGVINADTLRLYKPAVDFVKKFTDANRPIGAICHGAWALIEAHAVEGRTMTSWPSLKTDLENAGAVWVDKEVVVDERLVTSRKPGDIPAFNEKLIEQIKEFARITYSPITISPGPEACVAREPDPYIGIDSQLPIP